MRGRGLICIAALLGALATAHAQDAPQYRGIYVPTFSTNTLASSDAAIDAVLASNINAVFVEVRGRADAYYYPNRTDATYPNSEPRGQLYAISPADLDVLQHYIDRLHGATPPREVHAWLTTFNTWNRAALPASPAHVLRAHPEWITESADGTTLTVAADGEAPLDPGIPAVQDYIYNVFMDIVRNYDIDGIHFDYIRLIAEDSGFDPVAKAAFLADTGWNYDTQNTGGTLSEVYEAWRRDQISQLVQRVHTQTLREKPWVDVSGFLVNFEDSVEFLGQGYNWWVAHDAIDFLAPGCYSSGVPGTISDWNFFMSKLGLHGDTLTRPSIAAIGSYLFVDVGFPERNLEAVNTLEANARRPDGYVFFASADFFSSGQDDDLFNPGGPMDGWADTPLLPHKVAMGEERMPPNPPAAVSVTLSSGTPLIAFQRPVPAADGDLPVHYRVYRDNNATVDLYYDNLVMEWWDLDAARTDFSALDVAAPTGANYYAVVAYDDWNNAATATAGPVSVATSAGTYIIETRTGGLHLADYSEEGTFLDSSSHSTAAGLTGGIGSRFARPSDVNGRNDRARFAPSALASGDYDVYVTCFNFASANAPGVTARLVGAGSTQSLTFDLTDDNCGNQWTLVGRMSFQPGAGHHVEFDNTTQTTTGADDRMNAAAVRFSAVAPGREPKPPLPPASASSVMEIIVDSNPQALDYDDLGGASTWATETQSGYYLGSSRRFVSGNFPFDSTAVWLVDLPRAGRWAIDGWVRHNTSFAQGARYRFVDADGIVRNSAASQRSTFDSTTTGDWLIDVDGVADANAYEFAAGHLYITIWGNTTGSQTLIADALRLRYLGPAAADSSVWQLY